MKILRYDGSLVEALEKIFNLAILNLMWFLFSIPIVTIGASTTALFTVTLKMAKNEDGYIVKTFLNAFKDNLKKSSIILIVFLMASVWFFISTYILINSENSFLKILAIFEVSILVIIIMAFSYVFSILALYENTIVNIIKNSFIIATKYLIHSIIIIIIYLIPIIITGFVDSMFAVMIFFWIFWGISTISLFSAYVINDVFDRNNKKQLQ